MKLITRQRFFSWFDSYDIYDENGDTVFTVEGQLSIGHELHVLGKSGEHLATLSERIFTFLPKFEIYIGGRFMGEISKEFSLFVPSFNVDFMGWEVEGDLFGWDYSITKDGRTVATIQKEIFNFTDTYTIEVKEGEDALPALMTVLAIDAAKCSKK